METFTYTDKSQLVFVPSVGTVIGLVVQTDAGPQALAVDDIVQDNTRRELGYTVVKVQVLDDGPQVVSVTSDEAGGAWSTFSSGGVTGSERDLTIPMAVNGELSVWMTIATGSGGSLKRREQKVIIKRRDVADI